MVPTPAALSRDLPQPTKPYPDTATLLEENVYLIAASLRAIALQLAEINSMVDCVSANWGRGT